MLNIASGIAKVVTGFQQASAVLNLAGGLTGKQVGQIISDITKSSDSQGRHVFGIPNPLEQFASYTPLWTLACLTPRQFNDPRSYRNSPADLKHVVFSSAGRYDSARVKTAYGSPEYFINNFNMACAIAPTAATGNSNAIGFSFDIYEPHSMGLFLQSLQLAALNAGYKNYLNNAPYVLKLDIAGFTDDGKMLKTMKSKYFTVRLTKVTFNVNEGGTTYKVEAQPFNHQGFSTINNQLFKDVALSGDNVKTLLVAGERSLCQALNDNEKLLVEDKKKKYPNIYEVQFPETQDQLLNTTTSAPTNSATVKTTPVEVRSVGTRPAASADYGNNPIGQSDMGFDQKSGGNYVFRKEGDVYDSKTGKVKRDQMTIDPKSRTFQFTQGQSITAVISQIIISCRYIVENIRNVKLDEKGLIDWFKIDVQMQLLEFDDIIGDYQKKIIFRVVPYKTHISIFGSPTAAPPGYGELEKIVAKKYEYIYTGQNNDILTFNIQINNLFYVGVNPSAEKDNATVSNKDQNAPAEENSTKTEVNSAPAGDAALTSNTGGIRVGPDADQVGKNDGGSGDVTEAKKVAEAFNSAFLKSNSDLVSIDLEILGDPYWLVDSGIANYLSPPTSTGSMVLKDGSMNYEGGHVYIYLTFRTPADINENTGMYVFPGGAKESSFSGLYRVTRCENEFRDGIFKQKLKCNRLPMQSSDMDNKPQPIDKTKAAAVSVTQEEKPQTAPIDLSDFPAGIP